MLKLQFELEYQKINLVNRWETVATDSKNYLVARFDTLSDDWTMPITAIFTNDKDEQPYAVVVGADSTLESNECYIPWEVLKDESNVHVSAYCGNLHTTVTAAFHVYKSGYADGETPSPPSPTVYDAIMQAITALQNDKQNKLAAGENITIENNEISARDTNNYNDLLNRPQINGVTLSGNKTDDDLDVQSKIDNLHKLSSDLVDDTNKTNKFVSTSDKASWNAKYDKPNGGIPKTDLDSNVQASLNKADTAIQDISGKADKATTLSGYGITNAYTKAEVDAKLSSVYRYKGTVATYQDLPSTGLTSGDVYNVEADGNNYAWTGTVWDKLGGDIDLSGYQTKIDSSNKLSSDFIDDTDQTNKFVTDTDKTNWNNKLSSANGAVKSSNIYNGAVTTEKLGSGAVTSEKLASSSVTLNKLHSGVIDNSLSTQGAAAEAKTTGHHINVLTDRETALDGIVSQEWEIGMRTLVNGVETWSGTTTSRMSTKPGTYIRFNKDDLIVLKKTMDYQFLVVYSTDNGSTWTSTLNRDRPYSILDDSIGWICIKKASGTFTEEEMQSVVNNYFFILRKGTGEIKKNALLAEALSIASGSFDRSEIVDSEYGFTYQYVSQGATQAASTELLLPEFSASAGDVFAIKASVSVDYPDMYSNIGVRIYERYNGNTVKTTDITDISDTIIYTVSNSYTDAIHIRGLLLADEGDITISHYEIFDYKISVVKKLPGEIEELLTEAGDVWEV